MASRSWTCQRVKAGQKCGAKNPNRKRKCGTCGKARPARKRPSHLKALELTYEQYVEINGGIEACGICGKGPSNGRRLDRDHEHKGAGNPRGLLCRTCNRQLRTWATLVWLRAAVTYLERTED